MTSGPRVTVAIPTFNRSAMLAESIRCVLAQTFTDFRLIVGDNASDDDTHQVTLSFSDDRIEYTRSEHNVGPIANFNRLVALADSEFFMILSDDDIIYPGFLEATVAAMDRFPTAGLVHTATNAIDSNSKVIRCSRPLRTRSPMVLDERAGALERLMVSHWPMSFSSILYRTQVLVDAGEFREEEQPFADLSLWMCIALNWDFGYVSAPLGGLRVHPESISSNVESDWNSSDRDPRLIHADERYKRRIRFLAGAPLPRETKQWLSALTDLSLLAQQAEAGPPWHEVLARSLRIARITPRVLTQRLFWLVVLRVEVWRLMLLRQMRKLRARVRPT